VPDEIEIRWAAGDAEVRAAYALFVERIGRALVEDEGSFVTSATVAGEDWAPRLGLAMAGEGLVAAQLGGLLPAVGLLSLPYTAVAASHEGRGIYRRLKEAMLARLRDDARARGLPEPAGNVAEEHPGSGQYRRKIGGGFAIVLPVDYVAPAAQGLAETPLALTYEPLTNAPPPTSPEALRAVIAAVYRGLYRVAEPERDPSFRRTIASIG
jgi:GNAT superfamily N-acetyltransferase